MDEDKIKQLVERFKALRSGRDKLEKVWASVAAIYGDVTWEGEPGFASDDETPDSTPLHAVNSYVRFLSSVLRPRGQRWVRPVFAETILNEQPFAKEWLDTASHRMMQAINSVPAQFQKAGRATDRALTQYGIGFMFADEREPATGRLRFRAFHPRHCYIDVNETGRVNTVFRQFASKPYQLVRLFGRDNLHPTVRDAYDDPDKRYSEVCAYIHVVMPAEDAETYGLKAAGGQPFVEAYIDIKNFHVSTQNGYFEFPWIVPRQDVMPGTIYGYSIAMMSLGDSRMLQFIAEALTDASEYALNPPLVAMDDALASPIRIGPKEITYVDPTMLRGATQRAIERLDVTGNIAVGLEHQMETRQQVMKHFLDDVFSLPDRSNMSATEIQRRNEDLARVIGPITDDLLPDYNGGIGDRVFGILMRADQFPGGRRGPEPLRGQEVEFEYQNPVTRLENEAEAAVLTEQIMASIEMATTSGRPDMLDHWNFDEVMQVLPRKRGIDQRFINPPEEVEQIRARRQQVQQPREAVAEAEQAAASGANIAEAVKMIDSVANDMGGT